MTQPSSPTIVGAGIIGLATAFELTELGFTPTIYDPDFATRRQGASYFAGGMLAPIAEVQYQQEALFPLMDESARLYPDFLQRLRQATDCPFGYDTTGTLLVGVDQADKLHLSQWQSYYSHTARTSEQLTIREARALEPGLHPQISTALRIPGDHQLHPRLLLAALEDALRRRGVRFVAEAIADDHIGDIRCTGLGDSHRFPLRPVYGDILRVQAPRPLVNHVIRGVVRGRPIYILPRPNLEIAIGATSREDGISQPTVADMYQLLHDAQEVLPALETCTFLEAHTGARPGTFDDLPIFDIVHTNSGMQVISNGYFRHGILLAPLAAKAGAHAFSTGEILPIMHRCQMSRFSSSLSSKGS
ncbi:glycine oxidase ThiO [Corynebacterium sp. HS2168-gen11]|uniref:glycine oxidase ThiO n=1 Tax=Corynebacterium sp. HS2168-gen11 TaxID=2974027 RepID=UPI00216B4372|nr:glycine oxidase ThiO [Corynebacterium sp. HS2168-gen11]MCS4536283.1 glycine oxidase ThiO [Corynebacterium sp. HS2168-gen11]